MELRLQFQKTYIEIRIGILEIPYVRICFTFLAKFAYKLIFLISFKELLLKKKSLKVRNQYQHLQDTMSVNF